MGPLLALALFAGDPDTDWSEPPSSPPPEVSPAPAPGPPSAVPDVDTGWHSEAEAAADLLLGRPLEKSFRVAFEIVAGVSPSSMGQLGVALEVDWYPFKYLRLHGSAGATWVPREQYYSGFLADAGALRFVLGFDGVLPFAWGELYVGVDSGAAHTNVNQLPRFPCSDFCGYVSYWEWQPTMRLRAGFELTRLRPLIVGADLAYSQFPTRVYANEVHFAELHGRFGVAF